MVTISFTDTVPLWRQRENFIRTPKNSFMQNFPVRMLRMSNMVYYTSQHKKNLGLNLAIPIKNVSSSLSTFYLKILSSANMEKLHFA